MPEKTSVAAFYLKKKEENSTNNKIPETLKQRFTNEIRSITAGLKERILDFDAKEFAKNFAVQCPSAFVMKYASAILTNLANGRAFKTDAILDILFIDMAPLMKQTQLFLGYMSYDKFRLAFKNNSGKINIYGLLDGMNHALKAMQNEKKMKELENQYDEIIPIDLIESCTLSYDKETADFINPNPIGKLYEYRGAKNVGIKFIGHMKNLNGNFTKSNDYIQKLEKCMAEDKANNDSGKRRLEEAAQITFRIGSDIYENCVIKKLDAEVSCPEKSGGGVYDMKITVELLYNISSDMETYDNGLTKVNPHSGIKGDYIADKFANV